MRITRRNDLANHWNTFSHSIVIPCTWKAVSCKSSCAWSSTESATWFPNAFSFHVVQHAPVKDIKEAKIYELG